MSKYSFEDIKTLLLKSIKQKYEAELSIILNHYEYMIIIYEDHCSFQKCGYKDKNGYISSSGEICFQTLDELYHAQLVDNIVLSRDWNKIEALECMEFDILGYW